MRHARLVALLAGLVLANAARTAVAAPPEPGPVAIRVIEDWLLPRYDAFAAATAAQASSWSRACADKAFASDLEDLRQSYQAAADTWAAVEHVTVGPVSLALRPDRIFFGPDRRNSVAKALAELMQRAGDGALTPEAMRRASVAAQGFPALERLLWETEGAADRSRCAAGAAIAENLAGIARDVAAGWRAPEGPLARLKRGEGDPIHFADPKQALARLLTDLAGGAQRASDVKLLAVLGSSVDAAKPKAAEGWRSGRSARAIKALVASLSAQERILGEAAPKDVAEQGAKAFAAAEAAVAKLPDDLGEAAADPKRRRTIEAAIVALKATQAFVATKLAPSLGAAIGFNALDGD